MSKKQVMRHTLSLIKGKTERGFFTPNSGANKKIRQTKKLSGG